MALPEILLDSRYDFARNHSYVALDVPSWSDAMRFVDTFGSAVTGYKVGLELFHAAGASAVERLAQQGKRIFLDVKLHDIPNTVASALKVIADYGVEMVNVHALGGTRMLEAARNAIEGASRRPLLIAVTVLTSLGDEALAEMTLPRSETLVSILANLAHDCGLDGVVASALDVESIYKALPETFVTVIPGTRRAGAATHDQVRTRTPQEAIQQGATHLVLGRAVTQAHDPLDALKGIWDDMLQGKEDKERGAV